MKRLRNKPRRGIEALIFTFMPIPFVVGIIGLFSGNEKDFWGFVFMILIGLILFFVCFHWNKPSSAETIKDLKFTYFVLDEITEVCFCLREINYNSTEKEAYTTKDRIIYWREIADIAFDGYETSLIISLKDKEQLVFPADYDGWYALIRQVPLSTYANFDEKIVEKIYGKLESCKICGAIAVTHGTCQNCYNDRYRSIWAEEGIREIDYIKEEQLSYFATDEEGEAIDFSLEFFDRAIDWELLVPEEEILEYSAEFFW